MASHYVINGPISDPLSDELDLNAPISCMESAENVEMFGEDVIMKLKMLSGDWLFFMYLYL